jgi:hypothetical protein
MMYRAMETAYNMPPPPGFAHQDGRFPAQGEPLPSHQARFCLENNQDVLFRVFRFVIAITPSVTLLKSLRRRRQLFVSLPLPPALAVVFLPSALLFFFFIFLFFWGADNVSLLYSSHFFLLQSLISHCIIYFTDQYGILLV